MRRAKGRSNIIVVGVLALCTAVTASCSNRELLPLVVSVPGLSISKIPFAIAADQGLYEKYGLHVELRMPSASSGGQSVYRTDILTKILRRLGLVEIPEPDITVNGATPMMVALTQEAGAMQRVALAATDCVVRAHVIGRKGIASLDELKGGRLGVSSFRSTTGMTARVIAEHMGWDPVQDISIMAGNDEDIATLHDGTVDAVVANERAYLEAIREDLPILADTKEWNEALAGNSVTVDPDWLDDETHREAAKRFLMATAEAIALFHQRPDIVRDVYRDWYGVSDAEDVEILYSRGAWIPRKPYPCHEGYRRTAELYDSNEMRRYKPEDFYDDSMMRELDESGFLDGLYQ